MDVYIYVYINIYISTLCEIWNSSTCNIKTANYASTLLKSWLFVCTALLNVCFLWIHTPVLHVSCMRYVGDTEETCCKAAKVCFICICTSYLHLVYIPVLHVSYIWGMLGDTEETCCNTVEVWRHVRGMSDSHFHVWLAGCVGVCVVVVWFSLLRRGVKESES